MTSTKAIDRWLEVLDPVPMPSADRSGLAAVNGIKMHYGIYGSGAPVLLIHGAFGWGDCWASEVIDLSKDYQAIVADTRGHGRSTYDDQTLSYELLTDDYVALLDDLGIDKAAIVGWSDGAIIAINMAMRYRQRVTKVFAQAANVSLDGILPTASDDPTPQGYVARSKVVYERISPTPDRFDDFMGRVAEMLSTQPNWTDDQLSAITTPISVVVGDHDEIIKRSHTDHIAEVIPGARKVILKDVSHFAALQDPVGYVAAVRAFLAN